MNTQDILTALDQEIARLRQVRDLLSDAQSVNAPTRSAPEKKAGSTRKKRVLSPEARARIADAQRARWARAGARGSKTAAKKATPGRKPGRPAKSAGAKTAGKAASKSRPKNTPEAPNQSELGSASAT